jgi:hypothetical protein
MLLCYALKKVHFALHAKGGIDARVLLQKTLAYKAVATRIAPPITGARVWFCKDEECSNGESTMLQRPVWFRQLNQMTKDPKSIDYSCDGGAIANDKWKKNCVL